MRSPILVFMKTAAKVRSSRAADKPSLHIRLDFGGMRSIGPGKIRLLELITETGSISAAGRALKMSYRQAWLLVAELNAMLKAPVVHAQSGGGGGGGAALTETGNDLVRLYRRIERRAAGSAAADVRKLAQLLSSP
jgi:molybdate transport system regulatory protein